MKKENNALKGRILKKAAITFLRVLIITVFIITGCSKGDDAPPVSVPLLNKSKQISSFQFLVADNTNLVANVGGAINEAGKTITVVVPSGTIVTSLIPEIGMSTSAAVSPEGAQNFTNSVTYIVTAEDGTKSNYEVNVEVTASEANEIISFTFLAANNLGLITDVAGVVDETAKTIMAVVPTASVITGLTSEIEISLNATISPEGVQDFTTSVIYTVTAENGTSIDYEVNISTQGEVEREALTAIYDANPGNDLGWDLADPDVNNWDGVTTNADGNVLELDIGNTSLLNIPVEIGNLINLEVLSIDNMSVTSLPAEIGQLTNLTYLNLYDINLTSLPVEIWELTNLTFLNISGNNNLASVPSEIGELSNLIYLLSSSNGLTSIPEEISQLSNLTYLDLGNNNFTDFPTQLLSITSLLNLVLDGNAITSLPAEIGQLTNLIDLRLDYNNLTSLPVEIGQLVNLTDLRLISNNLTSLPAEIAQLNNLTYLDLRNNNLTNFPVQFLQKTSLRTLNLSNNSLFFIPFSVSSMTFLNTLNLGGNSLTTVPQAVCDLTLFGVNLILDAEVTCL